MFKNTREIIEYIKKQNINAVDIKFTDMSGQLRHITIPAREFSESVFKDGIGFDGSSVAGFKRCKSGDMCAVPDLSTAFIDPFWDLPTLSFMCNTIEADTKKPYDKDPRTVSKRAKAYLISIGAADEVLFAPEFEFNIFDSIAIENRTSTSLIQIISEESFLTRGYTVAPSVEYKMEQKQGYHTAPPLDRLFNVRAEMVKEIEKCNINVHYHHHEVGSAGQSEIEVNADDLTKISDNTMKIKYIIRNVAHRNGKTVTFMPKPLYKEAGNGMHVHQRLIKKGKNIFYDNKNKNYADLSDTALYYIGGLLKHGRALTAFTNPSTNSFKRLVPGFEAPVNLFFSLANRSAAIRIPKYAISPYEKCMEYRPPDFTCNIYYTLAALLMAGLDGIKNKIDPVKNGFGPYDVDMVHADKKIKDKIIPLPSSLEESMEALKQDNGFLRQGDVFTEELIESWIHLKSDEAREIRNRPHPYEFNLYYGA